MATRKASMWGSTKKRRCFDHFNLNSRSQGTCSLFWHPWSGLLLLLRQHSKMSGGLKNTRWEVTFQLASSLHPILVAYVFGWGHFRIQSMPNHYVYLSPVLALLKIQPILLCKFIKLSHILNPASSVSRFILYSLAIHILPISVPFQSRFLDLISSFYFDFLKKSEWVKEEETGNLFCFQ